MEETENLTPLDALRLRVGDAIQEFQKETGITVTGIIPTFAAGSKIPIYYTIELMDPRKNDT